MNIFITGGTGFIGKALLPTLLAQGHSVTALTRQKTVDWLTALGGKLCHDLEKLIDLNDFGAVINLAGEPIFDKPWTLAQKTELTRSRLGITHHLVELIQASDNPPAMLLSGSATGIYGDCADFAKIAENSPAYGSGFAAELCKQWEHAALKAQSAQTRVCLLRTGIVLHRSGGALARMLPLYRVGLGGRLSCHGKQHWAWIALDDHIRAIQFLLENPHCHGAFNLVAPESASQADFNRQLARQLHRPALCHAPAFLLKNILGERTALLLDNQPLTPQALLQAGFTFTHPTLPQALTQALR